MSIELYESWRALHNAGKLGRIWTVPGGFRIGWYFDVAEFITLSQLEKLIAFWHPTNRESFSNSDFDTLVLHVK